VVSAIQESAGIRPREAALQILTQVREGRPFDAALAGSMGDLTEPDRRLAHELAAGVLRQRQALDHRLAPLVSRGWSSVAGDLQDILRLGAYQITVLERVPAHAAVDTSVALAKQRGGPRAAGFVNAVLRRLSGGAFRAELPPAEPADRLAAEHSHPAWLVRRWIKSFGLDQAEALLRWNNTRPRLTAQPARQDLEALATSWRAAGLKFQPAPYQAGLIPELTRPAELPGYREGHFIIQDPAQALLSRYIDPPQSAQLYDACAAPGGKTISLGRKVGRVVAGEIDRLRARRLFDNVSRAGSGREHVIVADARRPPVRPLDIVLLDAPCLGTGTIARHPDARWRMTPRALKQIVELQADLLDCTAQRVAPGGLLVYSTCSLEPEENQQQVDAFLERHPEFERESVTGFFSTLLSDQGDLLVQPQLHGIDGAYAARLRLAA
jgi:16S rRNA (cytosine967-C5)-methyltransferase